MSQKVLRKIKMWRFYYDRHQPFKKRFCTYLLCVLIYEVVLNAYKKSCIDAHIHVQVFVAVESCFRSNS